MRKMMATLNLTVPVVMLYHATEDDARVVKQDNMHDAQDIAVEYATALAQSALDRTSTGKGGKLQAEDVLFVVRKVSASAALAQMLALRPIAELK